MATLRELEFEVIGSVYANPRQFFAASQIARPEHFEDADARRVWSAMVEIVERDGEDISTVNLMAHGVPPDVLKEMDLRGSSSGAEHSAKILVQQYIGRLQSASLTIITRKALARDGKSGLCVTDPATIMSEMESVIAKTQSVFSSGFYPSLNKQIQAYSDFLEINAQGGNQKVRTGYMELDKATNGGFELGDLVLLGGPPGTGKTAFALNLTVRSLALETPVGFIEAEMKQTQIFARLNAIRMCKAKHIVTSGREFASVNMPFLQWLHGSHFMYVQSDDNTRNERALRGAVEHLARNGCQIIVIDFLQCFRARGGKTTEYESVSSLVSMLRGMSLRLNVVILAIASNNRDVDKDGRAGLGSFRGSGELEYNAAIAIQLHRVSKPEEEYDGIRSLEMNMLKNREGNDGIIKMQFNLSTQEIYEPGEKDIQIINRQEPEF